MGLLRCVHREQKKTLLSHLFTTLPLSLSLCFIFSQILQTGEESRRRGKSKSCRLDHQTRVSSLKSRRDTSLKPKIHPKIQSPISPSPLLSGNLPPPRLKALMDARIPVPPLLRAPIHLLGFGWEMMGTGFLEDRVAVS